MEWRMNESLIAELQSRIGEELGVSAWFTIDQARIDEFASATNDPDPMHVDPAWARENSPFRETVSFGFLTMSLLTSLYHDVMEYRRIGRKDGYGLNYGFDRLRLVSPVPVNSAVRGHFRLTGIEERQNRQYLLRIDATIEIESQEKPALVAEWLVMWIAAQPATSVTAAG
jgi:acyl dehydratase